ncbi:homoserine kinase [Saccharopolyspora antimicrobica]|uniref:Homoserine kinase n=1 Tax=Saccharopolyspora antimicrobica TaxID=455193 RepID=A0A1I5KKA4_9PSEU|nr:homoserine kinase [Saccharopolyspora antimicrobica]RKT85659.1 homoserine kinase [Saccharopolyspora antimicrobica]SFO84991.1 homoserine kinase [Saccharopolyspora antimicrobica]
MTGLPVSAVRVKVPGSTANLGSGFDALGMALSLYDNVFAQVVDGPPGSASVQVEGEGAGSVPTDERHLVVRVVHKTLAELGFPAPALRLHCENSIPHARGLGSSAAAIVAGVATGFALAGIDLRDNDNTELALHLAAAREGHADNAAASLLGGFVVAWQESGRFRAVRMQPHPDVSPIAFVPQVQSATDATRGLLPERVPHADAAFAAGRAALAVHAMTRAPELLLAATADRLHQDYRESAWPDTIALVRRLREAGVAAAVSGAGPTVLALPTGGQLPAEIAPNGFQVLRLPVDDGGVRIVEQA